MLPNSKMVCPIREMHKIPRVEQIDQLLTQTYYPPTSLNPHNARGFYGARALQLPNTGDNNFFAKAITPLSNRMSSQDGYGKQTQQDFREQIEELQRTSIHNPLPPSSKKQG